MALRGRRLVLVAFAALSIALLAACGGDGESPSATATPTATQTATPTASPAAPTSASSVDEEVAAAYLAYWDAYSEAVLNLDVSLVEGLASGDELEGIREEIETLRSQGIALRIVVEHDFAVVDVSADTATVFDQYTNNSFAVDPVTKEPPTADGSGEVLRDAFFLEKSDGRWVVVRSVRQQ
jgi:hypothetical protein